MKNVSITATVLVVSTTNALRGLVLGVVCVAVVEPTDGEYEENDNTSQGIVTARIMKGADTSLSNSVMVVYLLQ